MNPPHLCRQAWPNGKANLDTSLMKRQEISAADLYVLLNREFQRRKRGACEACQVQPPFRIDRTDGGANWEIVPPRDCGCDCAHVIEEVVNELASRYDLKGSP